MSCNLNEPVKELSACSSKSKLRKYVIIIRIEEYEESQYFVNNSIELISIDRMHFEYYQFILS